MYGSRIVTGLAVVLGGMAALFAVLAVVYNLVFLFVAAVFGLSAYFIWDHASGRMARRLYRGVEDRAEPATGGSRAGRGADRDTGGFGAGPRADRESPGDGGTFGGFGRRTARGRAGRTVDGSGRAGRARQARQRRFGSDGPTAREAYDALGLDPDADEATVTAAYRQKVKEVHPDRPGGDEEQFKEVQAAYERLTD